MTKETMCEVCKQEKCKACRAGKDCPYSGNENVNFSVCHGHPSEGKCVARDEGYCKIKEPHTTDDHIITLSSEYTSPPPSDWKQDFALWWSETWKQTDGKITREMVEFVIDDILASERLRTIKEIKEKYEEN